MADGHLRTIKCAIENAQRCLQDKDSCPTVALSKVRQAFDVHSILNDSHAIPAEESGDIRRSVSALETALKNEIEMNRRESSNDFAFSARRIPTGGAGRQKVYLPKEQLQMFVRMGYTAKKMAKHFKCSAQLVYKRLYEDGIHMRDQYKRITDNELDAAVKELNDNHPNTGATVQRSKHGRTKGRHGVSI